VSHVLCLHFLSGKSNVSKVVAFHFTCGLHTALVHVASASVITGLFLIPFAINNLRECESHTPLFIHNIIFNMFISS